MRQIPVPQEIYRHFKGNLYQIVTIAEHSETGEQFVIYQALYGDFKIYARPLSMFMEKTDKEKYPEAHQEYRFERIRSDGQLIFDKNTQFDKGILSGKEKETPQEEKEKEPVQEEREKESAQKETEAEKTEGETENKKDQTEEGEANLDPMVIEFLDASGCEERLNILSALHHRITGDMLNIMSIALDIELKPGDIEEQYAEFRSCLALMERFESNRLRK